MASAPIRDSLGGHLLSPQNAAMFLMNYQPSQFAAVHSMDRDLLLKNIVSNRVYPASSVRRSPAKGWRRNVALLLGWARMVNALTLARCRGRAAPPMAA
jgi:hypothetical protein